MWSSTGRFTLAKKDGFDIEWEGEDVLLDLLDDERLMRIALEEYTKLGLLAEEGMKALVHHDEGDLEDSISFDPAIRQGDHIIVEGGSNSPYAWKRHEEPYRMGTYTKYDNGSKYPRYYLNGRGRRTLTKPSWRGIRPGRKYAQNAINAIQPDYEAINARILERWMNGEGD